MSDAVSNQVPTTRLIRAIEDSFPIVEINRLAVPERNAFKPIYQMHKWFAQRASCVFRAILLGCLKPLPLDEHGKPTKTGAQVIMEEFYKDHTDDPDTKDKVILDPFMGGGTTVVEALRLGCRVIGIDLNPVAWFIVKTEVEPVDLNALQDAFERLAERPVAWSGKSVRETLLSQYRTECPCCQAEIAARPVKKKPERKKVPLAVLLCPFCEAVWQWRGEVPDSVACPICRKDYNPLVGNIPGKGEFLCASCGHRDAIIQSIRRLPEDQLLPIHPYALEGYCARCGGDGAEETEIETEENVDGENDLFGEKMRPQKAKREVDHPCRITKNGGKFFKRVSPADLRRIDDAVQTWEREKPRLPYPKQAIPNGQETHRLLEHHYRYWRQMFHPRQLLCLATLL